MILRNAEARVEDLLGRFPAVVLVGPRQVGKTTLALAIAERRGDKAIRLDLQRPSDRARLADPEAFLDAQKGRLVILDEIHRAPDLFQVLRAVIDERRRAGFRTGQFLLLGSASLVLLRQASETLAGRIAMLEMTPLQVEEVEPADEDRLWVRGGFPDSFLAPDDSISLEWREFFVRSYLERDIPELGPRIPAETMRRFWTMLAHEQATMLNAARIAAALGVSGATVARYLDLLVDLLLVRRLQPWAGPSAKRLIRSPKVQIRDSGVVHALLGLRGFEDILGHPVAGASWEAFAVETLLAATPAGTAASYYRTAAGAEVDLVLELPGDRVWAVEMKRSSAPTVSKGFHLGAEDVGASARYVVHPGPDDWPVGDVQIVGLRSMAGLLRAA
jgi:predicted AAA+ superfamily ATPase